MRTLYFKNFLKKYEDATLAMNEAVKSLLPEGGCLKLEPTVYDFYPEFAQEISFFISNNDSGIKKVAIPICCARNIVIDGQGAVLRFFGRMMPVVVSQSENICIKNITIQYDRPFFTEAEILEATDKSITVHIDKKKYPYYVEDSRLFFTGYKWETDVITDLLQYNLETKDVEIDTADFYTSNNQVRNGEFYAPTVHFSAQEKADGTICLSPSDTTFPYSMKMGNVVVLEHATRYNPGIFGTESSELRFENITVHHCEGMAFIMQVCRNVQLFSCQVIPLDGCLISASADATHFVNCTGTIELKNCLFLGQMDDAVNIHGIYTTIEKIEKGTDYPDRIYLRYRHFQQNSTPIYKVNDIIRFTNCHTMEHFGEALIRNVSYINAGIVCLEVNQLPSDLKIGDGVENFSRMPSEVQIIGCKTGNNRARSFLISCLGKVLIEDNELHPNGAAVWISGDCNFWFESGPVQEVEICRNRIIDSNRGIVGWGHAPIEIVPEIPQKSDSYYHGRISVHDNEFVLCRDWLVYAKSVENLEVYNNRIRYSKDFYYGKKQPVIEVEQCEVHSEGNMLEDQKELVIQNTSA